MRAAIRLAHVIVAVLMVGVLVANLAQPHTANIAAQNLSYFAAPIAATFVKHLLILRVWLPMIAILRMTPTALNVIIAIGTNRCFPVFGICQDYTSAWTPFRMFI